jgi:nifR3 family TIM-barrel protein
MGLGLMYVMFLVCAVSTLSYDDRQHVFKLSSICGYMAKKSFPKLDGKCVLAPMSGVTNVAFRHLCRGFGAAMAYTEFVSSVALVRGKDRPDVLAKVEPDVSPCAIQLFGKDELDVLCAAKVVEKSFDVIDINVGCPAHKVVSQGCGSELLKDPKKVGNLVTLLSEGLSRPVTVKIRSGINRRRINAVEVAKVCEDAGAAAVTVHARTQDQGYSGKADWNIIKQVKEVVDIPVIGNGDVRDEDDAKRMLEETGCDYVMVGRAARNDPHIFARIDHFLRTGKRLPSLGFDEKMDLLFVYFRSLDRFGFNDHDNLIVFKQAAQSFTKGYGCSAKMRLELNDAYSIGDIQKIVDDYRLGVFRREKE